MGLAAEDRLLLLGSRTHLEGDTVAQAAEILRRPLDWAYIVEAATRHSVAPLLYQGLRQIQQYIPQAVAQVPETALGRLAELYSISQARNRRMLASIAEVCHALSQVGIPVMGLKELAIGRSVYPDPALRPLGDVDLLIRAEDYDRAASCLVGLGFQALPIGSRDYVMKYAWGHHFRRAADDLWIDLQWNVMQIEWDTYREGNLDFDLQGTWARALPAENGTPMQVPSLEDLLFHLCVHLEGHQYSELILLCDIAELLKARGAELDWTAFAALARQRRVESFIHDPLYLVQQFFQVGLPAGWLQDLHPAYTRTGLMSALFSNLGRQHLELDEIEMAVHPPVDCMRTIEATVRRQAACAMQLYRTLDGVAQAFMQSGGSYLSLDGDPSGRVFSDAALPAFGALRLAILSADLHVLRQALRDAGFETHPGSPGSFSKLVTAGSLDPTLAGQSIQMRLAVEETAQLPAPMPVPSRSQAARAVLKAHLGQAERAETVTPVQLWVTPLQPEEFLQHLAWQAGQAGPARLLALVNLLNFLQINTGQEIAVDHLPGQAVDGLALALEVLNDPRLLVSGQSGAPIYLFKYARPGTDYDDRYAGMKRAFYLAWCWLSSPGWQHKLAYFAATWRKPVGGQGPAVFPAALKEVWAAVYYRIQTRFGGRQPVPVRLAYWVSSEAMLAAARERAHTP